MSGNHEPAAKVVDFDIHLPDADPTSWREFLPRSLWSAISEATDADGVPRLLVHGRQYPKPQGPGKGSSLGTGASASVDDEAWSEYFTRYSVRTAVLQPGFVGLAAAVLPDGTIRRELAAAHNRRARAVGARHPSMVTATVVLPSDPEWSIQELEDARAADEVRVAVARPTDSEARPFATPTARLLLDYLAHEGILLCLHGATGYHQASPLADLFEDYVLTHLFSHPFEQQLALADLMATHAFDRGLRLAILEAGCGWLGWFGHRLQSHLHRLREGETKAIEDLLGSQLFVSTAPDDADLGAYLGSFGTRGLVFGSDFPHWDAAPSGAQEALTVAYSDEVADAILHRNGAAALAHSST